MEEVRKIKCMKDLSVCVRGGGEWANISKMDTATTEREIDVLVAIVGKITCL